MNVVTLCWARSVPSWVTAFRQVNHLGVEPGTQAYSAWACPLCRLEWVSGNSWGSKRAYHVTHQAMHVVSQCSLNAWLVPSRVHCWLMVSGGALETCSWRCAIQMAAFISLTLLYSVCGWLSMLLSITSSAVIRHWVIYTYRSVWYLADKADAGTEDGTRSGGLGTRWADCCRRWREHSDS